MRTLSLSLFAVCLIVLTPGRAVAQSAVQDAMRGYQESYNRVARQGAARQQEQIQRENADRIAKDAARARFKRKHRSVAANREHPAKVVAWRPPLVWP